MVLTLDLRSNKLFHKLRFISQCNCIKVWELHEFPTIILPQFFRIGKTIHLQIAGACDRMHLSNFTKWIKEGFIIRADFLIWKCEKDGWALRTRSWERFNWHATYIFWDQNERERDDFSTIIITTSIAYIFFTAFERIFFLFIVPSMQEESRNGIWETLPLSPCFSSSYFFWMQ